MATIKFLRDTLNFGDAVIRKLRTFKDVSIKGELYSRELFSRHFKTDGANRQPHFVDMKSFFLS